MDFFARDRDWFLWDEKNNVYSFWHSCLIRLNFWWCGDVSERGEGGLMGPVFIFKRKYFNSLCTCVHVFFPIYIKQTDYNSQGYKNWQVGNQHDRVLIYLSIGRNLQQLNKFHGLYKIIIMPDKILIYEDCYFFYLTYWLVFINNNLLNFTNYSW